MESNFYNFSKLKAEAELLLKQAIKSTSNAELFEKWFIDPSNKNQKLVRKYLQDAYDKCLKVDCVSVESGSCQLCFIGAYAYYRINDYGTIYFCEKFFSQPFFPASLAEKKENLGQLIIFLHALMHCATDALITDHGKAYWRYDCKRLSAQEATTNASNYHFYFIDLLENNS
jgi:hypothetical protein